MKKSYLLYLGVLIFGVPSISFANETYLQDEINQLKDDIVVIQRQLYRDKNDTTAPYSEISIGKGNNLKPNAIVCYDVICEDEYKIAKKEKQVEYLPQKLYYLPFVIRKENYWQVSLMIVS